MHETMIVVTELKSSERTTAEERVENEIKIGVTAFKKSLTFMQTITK